MIRAVPFCAVLLMCLPAQASAQDRPNFSGRWVPAVETSDPARAFTITHEETSIAIQDWSIAAGPVVHRVNATDERSTSNVERVVSNARWNAGDLVIETTFVSATSQPRPGQVTRRTETWSLDRNGRLVIDVMERREGSSAPTGDRLVYRRQ